MSKSGNADPDLGQVTDEFQRSVAIDGDNSGGSNQMNLAAAASSSTSSVPKRRDRERRVSFVLPEQPSSSPVNSSATSRSASVSGPIKSNERRLSAETSIRSSPTVPAPPLTSVDVHSSGVLPAATNDSSRPNRRLGSGIGQYGYGTIMRNRYPQPESGGSGSVSGSRINSQEVPNTNTYAERLIRKGERAYSFGRFSDALDYYDRAISHSPRIASADFHCRKSLVLISLKRLTEAVAECKKAMDLQPHNLLAKSYYGSLLLRLGQVKNAHEYLKIEADSTKLRTWKVVGENINSCAEARTARNWKAVLLRADSAMAAGANSSPELYACKTEAYLKLDKLLEAESNWNLFTFETTLPAHLIFGMVGTAYLLFVRAQLEYALGSFDSAMTAVESAANIEPDNSEISRLLDIITSVARARTLGNEFFNSQKYVEASVAYGEGIQLDSRNAVLYCNRAACWAKLGNLDRMLNDCNQALTIRPNYQKALLRRASCYTELKQWAKAVKDYEILVSEYPQDTDIVKPFFDAQVELRISMGKSISSMEFGRRVEMISDDAHFSQIMCSTGDFAVVVFYDASARYFTKYRDLFKKLCILFPWVRFLMVDTQACQQLARKENIHQPPTYIIYKDRRRLKVMVCPQPEELTRSVKKYCA